MSQSLSHIDPATGRAKMVDVGDKAPTRRIAIARSRMKISPALAGILVQGKLEKGDAFTLAKTAGILAAKQTGNLIPLCHPLGLDYVHVEIWLKAEISEIWLEAEARTTQKTGVEMEALMAVQMAALTVYDMCKAVDKSMQILQTGLYRKEGGKSGSFFNPEMEWPSL